MTPQEQRRLNVVLGVAMFLAGTCLCPIGLVQLMAEGPHGPHGEITGDPTNNIRCLALCIPAFVLIGWGIALASKKR
jgi:hypothetical protein